MSRFIIQSIQFDEDGVVTLVYLDKEDALRKGGSLFKSQSVSVTPEAGGFYEDASDIETAALELILDITEYYRSEPPYTPGEEEEEDEDVGMGF